MKTCGIYKIINIKNEKFNDWKLEVIPHPSIKGELAV